MLRREASDRSAADPTQDPLAIGPRGEGQARAAALEDTEVPAATCEEVDLDLGVYLIVYLHWGS
jgi:hypothetical protein